MNKKSAYPKYFTTPEGRPVSIKTMKHALSVIKKNPELDYPGWSWYLTPGYFILKSFRDGMHDRINKRGMIHENNR